MGTRNLTCVVVDGEFKVAQYGQWDGYPSGAGTWILDFLRLANLDSLKEQCRKLFWITDEDLKKLWESCGADPESTFVNMEVSGRFKERYPALHRDSGYEILSMLDKAAETGLVDNRTFAADSLFCEWSYVVDLDQMTLEVYKGFQTEEHSDGRFASGEPERGYYPVRLVKTYYLNNLPSATDFLSDLEPEE